MAEWQKIETAPKDGTTVIVYRPGHHLKWMRVDFATWDAQAHNPKPRPFWRSWFSIASVADSREVEPTHWMSLPSPPEEAV